MAGRTRGGVVTRLKKPNKLKSAFILLKCSKRNHDDCRGIRDALIDGSSGYVQEAYTTNAEVDGERWCVAASALVPSADAKRFESHIRGLRTVGGRPVTVKKLKFALDER